MFDDQTTSRWIPRNQLGLPVHGYSQAVEPEGWDPASLPAQELQNFDATPAIAFDLGWDDEEFAERRPQLQPLPIQDAQTGTRQMRGSIEPQPVAPTVSSPWDLAADMARVRARPRLPLWLRALVPGVAVFGATLFGVVIVFVEPSAARPAAPTVPASVTAPPPALADRGAAIHEPTSAPAVRREAPSEPAAKSESPSAKARHTEASAPARASNEPAPAAVSGGRLGMLRLNSRPWSQVFVDGRPIGNTPIMGAPLSAGEHRIELVNAAMDVRKTIQVKIKPDEVVTKIVLLVD